MSVLHSIKQVQPAPTVPSFLAVVVVITDRRLATQSLAFFFDGNHLYSTNFMRSTLPCSGLKNFVLDEEIDSKQDNTRKATTPVPRCSGLVPPPLPTIRSSICPCKHRGAARLFIFTLFSLLGLTCTRSMVMRKRRLLACARFFFRYHYVCIHLII